MSQHGLPESPLMSPSSAASISGNPKPSLSSSLDDPSSSTSLSSLVSHPKSSYVLLLPSNVASKSSLDGSSSSSPPIHLLLLLPLPSSTRSMDPPVCHSPLFFHSYQLIGFLKVGIFNYVDLNLPLEKIVFTRHSLF